MKLAQRIIFGLISLSMITGCTGERCAAYIKGGCPSTWHQWGDKCYKVTENKYHKEWSEAKDDCIRMGGVMVAPQSEEESAFLLTLQSPFWINCNNLQNKDVWECEGDTTEIKYRNWNPGEPNYIENDHCVATWQSGSKWNNVPCNLGIYPSIPAICKKPAAPQLYF